MQRTARLQRMLQDGQASSEANQSPRGSILGLGFWLLGTFLLLDKGIDNNPKHVLL